MRAGLARGLVRGDRHQTPPMPNAMAGSTGVDASEDWPALLFLDILGTRSVWGREGVSGATALFARFQRLIREEAQPSGHAILSGAIESDSAAILCRDAASAISLGAAIYRGAFFKPSASATREHRMWLRGVVTPAGEALDVADLRTSQPLSEDLRLSVETYTDELLDAISAEKAGFKGMRLLVPSQFITSRVRTAHKIPLDGRNFIPFRHLDHSWYPPRLEEFHDVLWMASGDGEEWRRRRNRMSSRIRASARDAEEVLQAAATQVVFDECDAIMESVRTRPRRVVRRS
jgi:hypothetical protein